MGHHTEPEVAHDESILVQFARIFLQATRELVKAPILIADFWREFLVEDVAETGASILGNMKEVVLFQNSSCLNMWIPDRPLTEIEIT